LQRLEEKTAFPAGENPFSPQMTRVLTAFWHLIEDLIRTSREKDVSELFDFIMDKLRYRDYLLATPEGEERWDNVQELRTVAREYASFPPPEGLLSLLQGISLVSDVDGLKEENDAVTLITLHQAKGLEFPVVFIVGMEDGILPHIRSFDNPTQLEEERRLCYVGITRAKKKLYLVRAFRRSFMGSSGVNEPSRFLADIPDYLIAGAMGSAPDRKEMVDAQYQWHRPPGPGLSNEPAPRSDFAKLRPGDRVHHAIFGEGMVLSYQETVTDAECVITFKTTGTKKLLMSFARLEKLG
jgi:DNA helicase-2/ATP-dependent DNA helicase PcrA